MKKLNGHKVNCGCPPCQSRRGERKRQRVQFNVMLPVEVIEMIKTWAKESKASQGMIVERAIKRYFGS